MSLTLEGHQAPNQLGHLNPLTPELELLDHTSTPWEWHQNSSEKWFQRIQRCQQPSSTHWRQNVSFWTIHLLPENDTKTLLRNNFKEFKDVSNHLQKTSPQWPQLGCDPEKLDLGRNLSFTPEELLACQEYHHQFSDRGKRGPQIWAPGTDYSNSQYITRMARGGEGLQR